MQGKFLRLLSSGVLIVAAVALGVGLARFVFPQHFMSPLEAAPQRASTSLIRAPEFPAGADWLNTDKPLSLRALRGKIVLLDFWTYGCINCMHILPDLKKLERKYPDELVVISVHSAKFKNEQDTANIRNAMLRYNIEHPVLVDENMKVWNYYTVRVWPTMVLIDPEGRVVGSVAGEGNYEVLDKTIGEVAQRFRALGQLNEEPLQFALDAAKVPSTPLWYPGKVLAAEDSNHLFIADSNHHRIVIADKNGQVQAVAGSGQAGLRDGAFDVATFQNPQGMALWTAPNGDLTLFVADTGNHAIRILDLKRGVVTTVAGTGRQAQWGSRGGLGAQAALSSPWDLQLVGDKLFIAMAGPHQIWVMDLGTSRVAPYAGSGREARIDGSLQSAAFAQPSGLATDGKQLFVADSEISAIRAVDVTGQRKRVRTLAGGDLFDFGDRDGAGDQVRLQHPLGVAYVDGTLYFADTYNHKIKMLDPASGQVETFLGDGRGDRDGAQPQFYEPGGLSFADEKLYVADTNNHKIRIVDFKTETVSTLTLKNLPQPLLADSRNPSDQGAPDAEDGTIVLPQTVLAPDTNGELVLDIKLPPGHHLNEESPQRFEARVEGQGLKLAKTTVPTNQFKLPLTVGLATDQAGASGAVVVSTTIFYCTEGKGAVCKFKPLRFRAPFVIQEDGASKLILRAELPS